MNIEPNSPLTRLLILKDVPLDSSYTDTLDFSSASEQATYFMGKKKFDIQKMSPVRMQNNIRVPYTADQLYDCNYIMFQNANFSNKWFYAFIKQINYVNVNMCSIDFELDVMQTWWFDWTQNPCYVEREHVNDDRIGVNLVSEGFNPESYVNNGEIESNYFMNTVVISHSKFLNFPHIPTAYAKTMNGVPNTIEYSAFDLGTTGQSEGLTSFLDEITKEPESIVSSYVIPKDVRIQNTTINANQSFRSTTIGINNSLDGYVPKNNKLFTYPYNLLYCTNQNGGSMEYRWEFFNDPNNCVFNHYCYPDSTAEILLLPLNYANTGNTPNFNEGLVLDGFPQIGVSVDTYKAWVAQNITSLSISSGLTAVGGLGATIAGAVTANPLLAMGGAMTTVGALGNVLGQNEKAKLQGSNTLNTNNGSVLASIGHFGFLWQRKSCTYDIAKSIDDYFSMYGYKISKTKIPNITGRKSWNYVKTVDCKLTGSVPFDDMKKIKSIFDKGITFWHGDFVGDYSRDNSIV